MLIIARKKMQGFRVIDKDTGEVVCQVDLIKSRPDRASLGIEASQKYRILRDECKDHQFED